MLKRIIDIVFSFLGLLILSPVLFIIALLIIMTSSGNILFKQQRVGRYGKLFFIHKFRTMVTNAEAMGLQITVGHDVRITKVGKFLRKAKLDELPQLWDVLVGNMSLVGPRPEVPKYVGRYPLAIKQIVLSVRPGITDWASIIMIDENELLKTSTNPEYMYYNNILPEKLKYAVKYVNENNIITDFKIIFITIFKIFKR